MGPPALNDHEVERILDSAHALSMNCSRNAGIRKLKPEEQRQRVIDMAPENRKALLDFLASL